LLSDKIAVQLLFNPIVEFMPTPPLALAARNSNDHKGTFGRIMLVGGSRGMAGSIALSSIASLHAGAGLVSVVVPDSILETVASFHPSLMTIALPCTDGQFTIEAGQQIPSQIEKQDAIGVGPGMMTGYGSVAIVESLWNQRHKPVVFDADALNVIAQQEWASEQEPASQQEIVGQQGSAGESASIRSRGIRSRGVRNPGDADIVLTPHRGELARLTGVPPSAPERQDAAAIELANRLRITVVIKGGPTRVVSSVSDTPYVNTTGNAGMATAGSGDVLTGVIASLLGRGLSGWDAARLGVWIHGLAGDKAASEISEAGMTSLHLVESLAKVADRVNG
jgi:NAD(P)H-hydrate epimerase